MLLLRIIFVIGALSLLTSLAIYFFSRNTKYLKLSWIIFRVLLACALVILGILVLERLVIPL